MLKREKGSQIAEFALVLPLIALLVLIACEGVAIVRVHQLVTNAAREAARAGLMKENEDMAPTILPEIATCYLVRNGLTPTATLPAECSTGVDTTNLDCASGTYSATVDTDVAISPTIKGVQVQVSCGYQLTYLPRLPWFGMSNTIPLSATVVWRRLY